ncbi:MAG TPA: beta-ketoacyl-[acyl-carrier-protein] synthase family protein [Sulfurospirillum arcachonense]|nr:beta-ketoacyl-[acyl-carrier-protein] synthase family protein [Sulfurospirillum arcachonense]HIP45512.1 beta-ketoacyl-[acyl-carrier-protein] synthase family protein [Sulfurospirillum arcachonense]
MKSYINNYELWCNAGDTKSLMKAVYAKESALVEDTTFLKEATAGLGIMKYDDIYSLMSEVVSKVLKSSNLTDFKNTLLILGSSVGGMQECEDIFYSQKSYKNIDPNKYSMNALSDYLLKEFSFYDSRSISTACTSSANALLLAKRLINVKAYENVLVVGADGLCNSTVLGFHALSVLSDKKCRPFDTKRNGMNVAEAVAVLLVQNFKTNDSVELKGVGASSDAYHMTNPNPEALGAIDSMKDAIKDANLELNEIDYVNAHGTATLANDKVEALAVEKLFGKSVHVNSTKAITGHTLGAAGAVEAIISCEVIKHGLVPAQTGLETLDNKNINVSKESVKMEVRNIVSNSFAFGGNNTSIVLGVCT